MTGNTAAAADVRRTLAPAAVVWMALAMSVLDVSVIGLALPQLQADLNVDAATTVWAVNAYQIVIVALLFVIARFADRIGTKRTYLLSLAVFTAGSLACAVAPTFGWLIAARVLQGAGAAGLMALNSGMLKAIYPPATLGLGVGRNSMIVSITSALAPAIGALALAIADWRFLFLVNVPIGCVATILGHSALPDRPAWPVATQPMEVLCVVLGCTLPLLGASLLAHGVQVPGAAAIVFGFGTIVMSINRFDAAMPILPIDLLAIKALRWSYTTSTAAFAAQTMSILCVPFVMVESGYSLALVGLVLTGWPLGAILAAPLAGRAADYYPCGPICAIGLLLQATAVAAVGLVGLSAWPLAAACLILGGAGFVLFQVPNNRFVIASAPAERLSAAGAMQAMARVMGQALGATAIAIALHQFGPTSVAPLILAALVSVVGALASLGRPTKLSK